MPAPSQADPDPMRLRDSATGYGWISIGLHWIGAALIFAMLFIGGSIWGAGGELQRSMLRAHTTVGLGLYAVFWGRVLWRMKVGHPGRGPRQARWSYALGGWFHYLLLGAIVVMLLTGPPMAWAGGFPLALFDWVLPAPFGPSPPAYAALRAVHIAAATTLGWGSLLHIAAVIKHTAIDKDGAFDRIMTPVDEPSTD